MPGRPLKLTRPALVTTAELELIEATALRLLEEVGLEVGEPALAERARAAGFVETSGRFRLAPATVRAFLDETRGAVRRPRRQAVRPDAEFRVYASNYPLHTHDHETGRIVPFTTERLVAATRLVGALAGRGVAPLVPGFPADVPASLQALRQFRIGVENLPGRWGFDAKAAESLVYAMEMAEVMGRPVRHLPVYVFTPLTLSGESLRAVLQFAPRLEHISVGSMPAAGSTAPVRPAEAFALATAEIVGSALLLRECLQLPVSWSVSVFPCDLRAMGMSFGSPESLLYHLASAEVDAYLHGEAWWPAVGNMHTLAKAPDAQAAAEKSSLLTLGALWGARDFSGAGALSLDEVFSEVQLLLDLEMVDHVARLARGLDMQADPEACLADVKEALGSSFAGLERTQEIYRDLYWHPRLFARRFLGSWQAAGSPGVNREAAAMARQLAAGYEYRPPEAVAAEVARIYQTAERELA